MCAACSKYRLILLISVLLAACKPFTLTQYDAALAKVHTSYAADTSVQRYYAPYKDSLDRLMLVPLAETEQELTKQQPEGTLGNLLADILKQKAEVYTAQPVDAAVLNYGGIRIPAIPPGIIRVEHAYLLMPFDNYVVVQQLSGLQLAGLCDSMARKKGWPVAGLRFVIQNGKATDIEVGGQPLDTQRIYRVALNDYVANGGDGMAMLKAIPQQPTGKLFREAILEYFAEQGKAGKKISAVLEKRVSYAE